MLVDNDVNVMALGEHQEYFPDENQLIFVKVGTGIGAGLIIDGEPYRGAQGSDQMSPDRSITAGVAAMPSATKRIERDVEGGEDLGPLGGLTDLSRLCPRDLY